MSVTEQYLANNKASASSYDAGKPLPPALKTAVVACMDARLDVFQMLGLNVGDSHVIRNAGGAVSDDAIRSLTISQRLLGTREIILVHHTDCGMLTFKDEDLYQQVVADTGQRPSWAAESFTDLDDDVRQSIQRIKNSPYLLDTTQVRGFVFDVETGELREVEQH